MIRLTFEQADVEVYHGPDGSKKLELRDPHSGITVSAVFPREGAAALAEGLMRPAVEVALPVDLAMIRKLDGGDVA